MSQFHWAAGAALFTLLVSPQAAAADPAPARDEPEASSPRADPEARTDEKEAAKAGEAKPREESSTDAPRVEAQSDAAAHARALAAQVPEPHAPPPIVADEVIPSLSPREDASAAETPAFPDPAELSAFEGVPGQPSSADHFSPPLVPAEAQTEPESRASRAELDAPINEPIYVTPRENAEERDLREQIQARLQAKRDLSRGAQLVSVDVHEGTATLCGHVPTIREQLTVEQIVQHTPGVDHVRSELTPRSRPEVPKITAAVY